MVTIPGLMGQITRVNGERTKSMEWALTYGKMVEDITDNGSTTTCMDTVSTFTQMESATKDSTSTTKSKALGLTGGLMAASTMDTGTRVNNTVSEFTLMSIRVVQSTASGRTRRD